MNAVEIQHLTYTYPGAEKPTLNNLSLTVEQGDFLAIVGNNGCGKSTLCKALNGLIPHFITGRFEGLVTVDGQDTLSADVGELARKVGYVYQDFENQIVRPTVLDDASYSCLNYAFPDYKDRGRRALAQCGLEGREEEYVWQLSGGQTHLLALAGAVSLQPGILILDEPIAQLDPMHADRIYEVLRDLNQNHGKTIIVIEHHTEYIADYCKNVLLLKDGQVQWKLPTEKALQRVDELEHCNIFPPQVTQAGRLLQKRGLLAEDAPLPTTVDAGANCFSALPFRMPSPAPAPVVPDAPQAVEFENIQLRYRSVKGEARTIFDELNLTIRQGERVALIGSNGAGKSTLMKLLVAALLPTSGSILVDGQPLLKTERQLKAQLGYLPQDFGLFNELTVAQFLDYMAALKGLRDSGTAVREVIRTVNLEGQARARIRSLSGGQRQRVGIAQALLGAPPLLILDEPTVGLDPEERIHFRNLFSRTAEEHLVLLSTHIIEDVQSVCDQIVVIHLSLIHI